MMTALYLSNELSNLAEIEKEFKNEYLRLSNQCKDFAVSLLDLCWNHLEVSSILNNHDLGEAKNDDCTEDNDQHEPGLGGFSNWCLPDGALGRIVSVNPRATLKTHKDTLKLAIRYQVKKFVAHPNCQHQLLTQARFNDIYWSIIWWPIRCQRGFWNVSQWFKGSRSLGQSGFFTKLMTILYLGLGSPVNALAHWFFPKSSLRKVLKFTL